MSRKKSHSNESDNKTKIMIIVIRTLKEYHDNRDVKEYHNDLVLVGEHSQGILFLYFLKRL
jgi:hypothetical protein